MRQQQLEEEVTELRKVLKKLVNIGTAAGLTEREHLRQWGEALYDASVVLSKPSNVKPQCAAHPYANSRRLGE